MQNIAVYHCQIVAPVCRHLKTRRAGSRPTLRRCEAVTQGVVADVRFGGKADMTRTCSNVCFWPKADISGSRLLPCNLTLVPHSVGRKSLLQCIV